MELKQFAIEQGGTGTESCPVFASIADKAECHVRVLYQISLGLKRPSWRLAKRIASATNEAVTLNELLPELFETEFKKTA